MVARCTAEFVSCFEPAYPPQGWQKLMNEIEKWPTPMDRFADTVLGFLENMPDMTKCESHIVSGLNGWSRPQCDNRPTVCDLDSEFEFCAECWRRFQRGEFDGGR